MTDPLATIRERMAFAELSDMAYAATPEETAWLVREVERLRRFATHALEELVEQEEPLV